MTLGPHMASSWPIHNNTLAPSSVFNSGLTQSSSLPKGLQCILVLTAAVLLLDFFRRLRARLAGLILHVFVMLLEIILQQRLPQRESRQ